MAVPFLLRRAGGGTRKIELPKNLPRLSWEISTPR
jgi:hypothetical protein